MIKFIPAKWTGGNQRAFYYASKTKPAFTPKDAVSFPTEEEAWLFLESLGPPCSESCVLTPSREFRFSGVNDKLFRELSLKHNGNVLFVRSNKQYMLTRLVNG